METNQTDNKFRMQGLWERLHENGNIRWRDNFRNNIAHGLTEVFRENGNIWWRENYRDGILHGFHESFHDSGQLESIKIY